MGNKQSKIRFECYKDMQPRLTADEFLYIIKEHCKLCDGERIPGQCGWCNKQELRRIIKFIEDGYDIDKALVTVMNDRQDNPSGDKYTDDRYLLGTETYGKTNEKGGRKAVEK